MTNKQEIMIEIAKLKVKEAILKMCRERNLGGGSYDRIIMELFFEGLPAAAYLSDTTVGGVLRRMADEWEETEITKIEEELNN